MVVFCLQFALSNKSLVNHKQYHFMVLAYAHNDWKTFDLNRLNASLRFYYRPKFLEDIGLFVQLYHGMDYYNIYFQHQISVIRLGIMTEILRF